MKANKIVIHHSLTKDSRTVSWGAIRNYHMSHKFRGNIKTERQANELRIQGYHVEKPWSDVGYHFGIELAGNYYETFIGRMLDVQGAHARGQNGDSIGVCFVGNFDTWAPPLKQWQKGLELIRFLLGHLGLNLSDVYPHRAFANKSCPGKKFDFARFIAEI